MSHPNSPTPGADPVAADPDTWDEVDAALTWSEAIPVQGHPKVTVAVASEQPTPPVSDLEPPAGLGSSRDSPRTTPTWDEVEQELGQIVGDFQELQDDLNYRRAQDALRDLVQRLNLTQRERASLDGALQSLHGLMDKLEHTVVHIAVFGLVGRGKSSLLNALLGEDLFATGPTHGVTQVVEGARWSVSQEAIEGAAPAPDLGRVSLASVG
ncbi:MAG TPA: dynamin family protein, partial [Leptolyngbyaceae cyanobacterium M65_K2018_010]|nr:dynamin family protein [Leptolyngbyaceae cyanobacterium M65_K2018_010]